MKRIKLYVPQGLGDIFWVYQKFAPYFDEIDLLICVIQKDCNIQKRSLGWLKLFPKVKNVDVVVMHSDLYQNILRKRYDFNEILKNHNSKPDEIYAYNCNYYLERGIRIESIDPDWPIETKVNLFTEPFDFEAKDYIVFYTSMNTYVHNYVWNVSNWINFFKLFYEKFKIECPLVLIGAPFDEPVLREFEKNITNHIAVSNVFIGLEPKKVCHIIKNCKFFVGYQSGLNIIADNFDVKQLMMYFPSLEDLQESWPQKKNIQNKTYNSSLFNKSPESVLDSLPLRLFNIPTQSKFF